MPTYHLGQSKIKIEVIDLDDPHLNIKDSRHLTPKNLKHFVQVFDKCSLCVTATMPSVFLYLTVRDSKSRTYNLSYRAFLGFISELETQEERDIDWLRYGF